MVYGLYPAMLYPASIGEEATSLPLPQTPLPASVPLLLPFPTPYIRLSSLAQTYQVRT